MRETAKDYGMARDVAYAWGAAVAFAAILVALAWWLA